MSIRSLGLTALLCIPFLAGVAANAATVDTDSSSRSGATAVPAALRPVLYQTLAHDAGPAYAVGKNGCATVAPQQLAACFDRGGVHFRRRGRQLLGLALAGFGRGTHLTPVAALAPTVQDNRVSYRAGALTAWWRVLPAGFEQGFTIARRPAGSAPLRIALTASATPTRHADQLTWGPLHYGGLVATDATGKIVPSTLTAKNGRILIAVNDAHAIYPLTVDPLVWLEQKVTASDGAAGDELGWSVAVSGTTALVGAPNATVGGNIYQGAAYVFTESGGAWSQTQKLTASNGAANDGFGWSVALDGTTALVGAFYGGGSEQGAVYVFNESGGTWTQNQEITADNGLQYDGFGYSVALSGDTAVIGAPFVTAPPGYIPWGAAYMFNRTGGIWEQWVELGPFVNVAANFGWAVALDGSTAFIGTPAATDNNSDPFVGAVYVFDDSGGSWSQTQVLTASDAAANYAFGWSVALAGSTALIGSPGADGANSGQGAAYVFDDSGGTWTQTLKLTAGDGQYGDNFGYSVALSGTTALVGAPTPTTSGNPRQGKAYLFEDSGGSWTQTNKIVASDGAVNDEFGFSVALDGSTALVGAFATIGGNVGQGAAYLYGSADLDLALSAPPVVAPGAEYTSATIATNNASVASPAVAVTVAVPAAASFVSASASQGSCGEDANLVTCSFGSIDGNAGTATASVTLKATGAGGTTIENSASVAKASPPLSASAPTVIDSAPVAQDATLTVTENTSGSGTLVATDADGDPLTFSLVAQPANGTVSLDDPATGAYTYTPDNGFTGTDSFTFQASDGTLDSNVATITITVNSPCANGYTEYDGTLNAGGVYRSPPYQAPAGMENALLSAPNGFRLYAQYSNGTTQHLYRIPGNEIHQHGPAGTYRWGVKAGSTGGDYVLCLLHP